MVSAHSVHNAPSRFGHTHNHVHLWQLCSSRRRCCHQQLPMLLLHGTRYAEDSPEYRIFPIKDSGLHLSE